MKIELSKDQYKNLMKLVYLGEWMIDAFETGNNDNKFNKTAEYIYSFAKDFGLSKYIEYVEDENKYFPTAFLDDDKEINKFMDSYNDNTFWDELIERLTKRDLLRKHGLKAIFKMAVDDRYEKETPIAEKYETEFNKNGINNLTVKNMDI